jgi:hypothetical protein
MQIPNAGKAVISQEKVCGYLLNTAHRRGGAKAKLLLSMGYSVDDWQHLDADLRAFHLTAQADCERDTAYGKRYEIVAPLPGKLSHSIVFRSIWQIDIGTDYPRLITMHPE